MECGGSVRSGECRGGVGSVGEEVKCGECEGSGECGGGV